MPPKKLRTSTQTTKLADEIHHAISTRDINALLPYVKILVTQLNDDADDYARKTAICALSNLIPYATINEDFSYHIKAFSYHIKAFYYAIFALANLAAYKDTASLVSPYAEKLAKELFNTDLVIRRASMLALARLASHEQTAIAVVPLVSQLAKHLCDGDTHIRHNATFALCQLTKHKDTIKDVAPFMDALYKQIEDTHSPVRDLANEALCNLKVILEEILASLFSDSDAAHIEDSTIDLVVNLVKEKEYVEKLVNKLNDPSIKVREAVFRVFIGLALHEDTAHVVISYMEKLALKERLNDENHRLRILANLILANLALHIDTASAVEPYLKQLQKNCHNTNNGVKTSAEQALKNLTETVPTRHPATALPVLAAADKVRSQPSYAQTNTK